MITLYTIDNTLLTRTYAYVVLGVIGHTSYLCNFTLSRNCVAYILTFKTNEKNSDCLFSFGTMKSCLLLSFGTRLRFYSA